MKLTKKQEKEIWQVYDTWLNSYLNGDVETYNSFLDDDYHFIGSATKEEFLNRKDTTEFFAETGDQFAGKTEIRNESKFIEQFGDLIFITHVLDGWFLHEKEWNFYSRFRFSSILRKNKDDWRFIYQHFSIPDPKTAKGETIGYDKINEENQELREAIQRRTIELEQKNRELKIESALERIRAQAVAMKTSTDLLDIVVTMRNEFIKLGHEAHYFWHMMWLPETYEKAMTSGDGTRIGFVMKLPRHIHGDIPLLANWEKSKTPTVVYPMNTKEAIAYVDKMVALGDFQNIDPQAPSHDDIKHIGGLTFIMARTTHGEIGYSLPGVVENPPKADIDILVKFASAFDLAHQRFLDLQKAEKQARETQIELALEKVRSRSMAMHKSDELKEIIQVVYDQLVQLQVKVEHAGFILDYKEHEDMHIWLADHNAVFPKIVLPYFDCAHWNNFMEVKKTGQKFFTNQLGFEEKNKFYKDLFQFIPDLPEETKNIYFDFEGLAISTVLLDNVGLYIENYQGVPFSDEENAILMRFGKVFQQAYTRFLDLQKAEAQAHEAQIEAALEKVRSRSLAMHKSDELKEVVAVVLNKLQELDIAMESRVAVIVIFKEGSTDFNQWVASPTDIANTYISTPYFEHIILSDFWNAREIGLDFYSKSYSRDEKNTYFEHFFDHSFFKNFEGIEEQKKWALEKEFYTYSPVFETNSSLGIADFSGEPLSEKEISILKRFAKVFEQAYIRFLDLQKAEMQAREAQIESGLEKVRSRSLAMHRSDELKEVVSVLFEKLKDLQIPFTAVGIATNIEGSKDLNAFVCGQNEAGLVITNYRLPYFDNPISKDVYGAIEKQLDFFVGHYSKEEKDTFYEYVIEHTDEFRHLPEDIKRMIFYSTTYTISMVAVKNAVFNINDFEGKVLAENEIDIIKRFAKVFEQAYIRFLDLQKAEAQTREAQIEAALEKVRSRSLAMHTPNELGDVVTVIVEKLKELDVVLDANGVVLCTYFTDSKNVLHWIAAPDFSFAGSYLLPYFDHPIFNDAWQSRESGALYFSKAYSIEEKNTFWNYAFEHSDYRHFPDDFKQWVFQNDQHILSFAWQKNSAILIPSHTGVVPTAEDVNILKRFAKVFEQSYTRFLDLQKAEKQAKEAQIEAALERIRSRSMGMQKSEDLAEVVRQTKKEIMELGIQVDNTQIATDFTRDPHDGLNDWISVEEQRNITKFHIPFIDHPVTAKFYETLESDLGYFTIKYSKSEKNAYFKLLFEHSDFKYTPDERKNFILNKPGWVICGVISKNSSMQFARYSLEEFSLGEISVFKRFGKVFEQAYTRFLDLKQAEAQAREAQIEAALEKVRSRTLAMQKSDELAETSVVVFKELLKLGIEPNRLFIGIVKDSGEAIDAWATNEDGSKIEQHFTLYTSKNRSIKKMVEGWKQQQKSTIIDMEGEELTAYFHYLSRVMHIPFIDGLKQKRRVQSIAYFSGGLIGMASPQEQPEETINLLERFAAVFNLTYARFKDLKIAEAQARQAEVDLINLQKAKKNAEEALAELQTTQKQLIQQEKLASLGQLTAGIAHEIKNPLNFVNNFSEVSIELIEEALDEIGQIENNPHATESTEILTDVKANLSKIHEHGTRADNIVKSMLMHSRGGSGKMEPTDLNALIKEYVNLAFHGMRAGKNPISVAIDLQLDEQINKIPLVEEDFSRVLLNLCNNAFDAMRERLNANEQGPNSKEYQPKLTVRTISENGKVSIEIEDNGPGIPDDIKDKILQPFFTTKKGTEGTGLGLSITDDIIKAHGGRLSIPHSDQKGTIFRIDLLKKESV